MYTTVPLGRNRPLGRITSARASRVVIQPGGLRRRDSRTQACSSTSSHYISRHYRIGLLEVQRHGAVVLPAKYLWADHVPSPQPLHLARGGCCNSGPDSGLGGLAKQVSNCAQRARDVQGGWQTRATTVGQGKALQCIVTNHTRKRS
jgi:hypothetical protein